MSAPHPKIVAIIQARMNSTRLPGKVLAKIEGHALIWHVVSRVRSSSFVDQVVLATTDQPPDDAVAQFCQNEAITCFRGSEADVLDRFYQAAKAHQAEIVMRVNGDCLFTDPDVVNQVITAFFATDCDYATNTFRYTFPEGLDVEVFRFSALERAWKEAVLPAEREHVTVFIRNSGLFKLAPNVSHHTDLSQLNYCWSIDSAADLSFARAVFRHFAGREFRLDDVLQLIEKESSLLTMKNDSIRNEGFYLSLAKEPPVPVQQRSLAASHAMLERAKRIIPTQSQTFSKAPTQFVQGVAPNFIARGAGCHVWDIDGNEYIDHAMALAPIVIGHADPDVTEAVSRQIKDGTAYSLPHALEVEVAEMLVEVIPCAEMVRFGKNGSDATAGAVRVARAFTGRDIVAMCGYHGWQDWCIGTTTRNKGVPKGVSELTKTFTYNDIASLERIFDQHPVQVAAVIMEATGVIAPQPGFLESVKELAHKHGALLIFDEIVTGFRLAIGGAQEYFNVIPDLACCGKAMGNGYPIAAVAGRRDVMEWMDEIFFSFTFGGETASLAATKAVITKMLAEPVIPHIWEQGLRIKDGYNVLARAFEIEKHTECIGYAPRTVCLFRDETGADSLVLKSLFQQECLKRGVLYTGGHNLSYSHSGADIEQTLRVYRTAMEILASAIRQGDAAARLEGPAVQPVFRKA